MKSPTIESPCCSRSRASALLALRKTPPVLVEQLLVPRSLLRRSMLLAGLDMNDRGWLEIELPAGRDGPISVGMTGNDRLPPAIV